MTRLTAKDRPGREVQVVIARAVVAKTQGHTGQAQVMIAIVVAAGKLGHTKVLVTENLGHPKVVLVAAAAGKPGGKHKSWLLLAATAA